MADDKAHDTDQGEPFARCDVMFRGARVLNGAGAIRRRADRCVTGNRIVGIGDHAARTVRTLAGRPKQPSGGIRLVMVIGQAMWRAGRPGGARPGRVPRRSAWIAGIAA
jgi:hypothetical protein